jgi:RNA polymerase sigma-70 factor (ECF subfamily)
MEERMFSNTITKAQKAPAEDGALCDSILEIYNAYSLRILNYVCYRVNNRHDAEDLTSQIFIKLFSKIEYYQENKAPLSAWIFCIARNTVTDYYRVHGRQSSASLDDISELADPRDGPDRLLDAEEMRRSLHSALKLLGEREQKIIKLKFWCGFSNRSIAKLLGLGESNVGVILYRAVQRLRHTLDS